MSREESQGFYEMLWDCPHCETKGLLGKSQRHCPECGAPQDASTRYFPTPEQQKAVVGHTYEGADRTCPSCSAPQAAKAKNCTQCGSPLDEAKEVLGVSDIPRVARAQAAGAPAAAPKKSRRWLWIVLGAVVLIGFLIWFFFIRSRIAEVTITNHHWERKIAIEEFGDHDKEAWRDQVPASASMPMCHQKQRSSHKVADGEDCHTERHDKGDGTFEQVNKCSTKYREEPVYDDWCRFTVRDWQHVTDAVANGTGLTPSWPVPDLGDNMARAKLGGVGERRAGGKTETYTLDFAAGDSCDVSEATWRKYTDGQKIKTEVRARSGNVVCGSL